MSYDALARLVFPPVALAASREHQLASVADGCRGFFMSPAALIWAPSIFITAGAVAPKFLSDFAFMFFEMPERTFVSLKGLFRFYSWLSG